MSYLPAGVAKESLRLAAEFQEATIQVAAMAAVLPEEAQQIVAEFMDVVVKTNVRAFNSYSPVDIAEWWRKNTP